MKKNMEKKSPGSATVLRRTPPALKGTVGLTFSAIDNTATSVHCWLKSYAEWKMFHKIRVSMKHLQCKLAVPHMYLFDLLTFFHVHAFYEGTIRVPSRMLSEGIMRMLPVAQTSVTVETSHSILLTFKMKFSCENQFQFGFQIEV